MINKCCSWANSVLRNIFLFGGSNNPPSPPSDTCYVFEFNMVDSHDTITAFQYNNGTQDLSGLNIDISDGALEDQIEDAIGAAFGTVPITYEEITVSRIDLGGGLFTYTITIKNPSTDIGTIEVGGNIHASTTTNCT